MRKSMSSQYTNSVCEWEETAYFREKPIIGFEKQMMSFEHLIRFPRTLRTAYISPAVPVRETTSGRTRQPPKKLSKQTENNNHVIISILMRFYFDQLRTHFVNEKSNNKRLSCFSKFLS